MPIAKRDHAVDVKGSAMSGKLYPQLVASASPRLDPQPASERSHPMTDLSNDSHARKKELK